MSMLPYFRKDITLLFTYIAVDLAGPKNYTESKRKKSIKIKGAYIFVVGCLVTRAIFLETAYSLQSKIIKHTLKAYMARRRELTTIFSDCRSSLMKI
jgi:hypothetical protein